MSIQTTYKCDKCGHEQDSSTRWESHSNNDSGAKQFWTVEIRYTHDVTNNSIYSSSNVHATANFCRDCMASMGILSTGNDGKEIPKPEVPVTMEDIIREIVHEEMGE